MYGSQRLPQAEARYHCVSDTVHTDTQELQARVQRMLKEVNRSSISPLFMHISPTSVVLTAVFFLSFFEPAFVPPLL